LDGIPQAPRGIPQIEVTFDIDANGILNVTARDKATGREQKVTITASTNLREDDIDRMVDEAKKHEAEDRNRKELAEARNTADAMAYQVEKSLGELGDKVPSDDRSKIEAKVQELRQAITGDDIANIKRLTEELQQASHALSQQIYSQQASTPEAGPETPPKDGGEDDVVEGEFREA
jgi:molecular chaperone DnaK